MNKLPVELQIHICEHLLVDVISTVEKLSEVSNTGPFRNSRNRLGRSLDALFNMALVSHQWCSLARPILARTLPYILGLVKPSPWSYREAANSGPAAMNALKEDLLDHATRDNSNRYSKLFTETHVRVLNASILNGQSPRTESMDHLLFPYVESICRLPKGLRSWAGRWSEIQPYHYELEGRDKMRNSFDPADLAILRSGHYRGLVGLLKSMNSDRVVVQWLIPDGGFQFQYEISQASPEKVQLNKTIEATLAAKKSEEKLAAKEEAALKKAAKKEAAKKIAAVKAAKKGPITDGHRVEKRRRKKRSIYEKYRY
ncbi:uncharacterized protein KY384_000793 [Bacidia gigantensis]|uniref:uncharacterized protein n=1 Tax=Bacidia gigantensis TaxID=2732470 RepID=UPI001D04E1A4|nr:uncharacterized protein KY384_000793 [Bacidia gigantensis]KAG8526031.1 hypothetical protein KY384_000793 [Bacidia gigantensis]